MTVFNVTEKKITSKINSHDKTVIIENIKYPHFDAKEQADKELCEKLNNFYGKIAEKYSTYARVKLVKKIHRNTRLCKTPMCLGMNYTVSECGKDIISVVLDLSFSEAKSLKMKRFSQMWHKEKREMISVGQIMDLSIKNKKILWETVLNQAINQSQKKKNEYYPDVALRIKKNFCFNNCFMTPAGVTFFFDAGVLRPEKYGASCFVLPYETIKDILKSDVVEEKTEFVNNI